MGSLHLKLLDATHALIDADEDVRAELADGFTFDVPGARFTPRYKSGYWDGKIRLFNQYAAKILVGLIPDALLRARRNGHQVSMDVRCREYFTNAEYSEEAVNDWTDGLVLTDENGVVLTLESHQLEAIHSAIRYRRMTLLSPTSSGKSLIIYCLARWLVERQLPPEQKVLVVVPTTMLVEQLHANFAEYSAQDPGFDSATMTHKIYSGKEKVSRAQVFVSTWQSLVKLPKEYFEQFGALVIDECHGASGKSLQSIADSCVNAYFRLGTTGTLEESKVDKLVIQGALGPIRQFVTTRELMDRGIVADLEIANVILKYREEESDVVAKMSYEDETKYIIGHHGRNRKIGEIVSRLPGNVLVLVTRKEHGKLVTAEIEAEAEKKRVFLRTGDDPVEDRRAIALLMDRATEVVLCATYATFSTGVSVRNINWVVFAGPVKGKIRVLQTIGRGLRKSATKGKVGLVDLIDDFSKQGKRGGQVNVNYALDHFMKRAAIYDAEQFDHVTRRIDVTEGPRRRQPGQPEGLDAFAG